MAEKPRQSFGGLWNISFGFFGIQIGFALQNANVTRIFQSLGESLDDLPALWIAAPLTGLLVQPLVGYFSDRTWLGRLGRRRPFFLAGAVLAAISLIAMPLSQTLLFAALMLWVLDAALNISMEPFRAFVGDMLHKDQHVAGYSVQTAFIGAGAVIGSVLPFLMAHWGVANVAPYGGVPDTVLFSFWFGAAALFVAVMWTVIFTREYSPHELDAFDTRDETAHEGSANGLTSRGLRGPVGWITAGTALILLVPAADLEKELYLLGSLLAAYGVASAVAIRNARAGRDDNVLGHIIGDFRGMPPIMKQLALVQFFSWSALFVMWIYTTPVVAQYSFGTTDTASAAYNEAANWVGILFATYNGVAALAALTVLPFLAHRIGAARTHIVSLLAGAAGFASFLFLRDPLALVYAEIGIGIAWASILSMPYTILASSLPQKKLGLFMGLFNVFIVLPQLLVATVMGTILKALFPTEPIWTIAFAAGIMVAAALAMLRVKVPPRAQAGADH